MTPPCNDNLEPPVGLDFLQFLREQEAACEAETRRGICKLPAGVSDCLMRLGTLLSLANRAATYGVACGGGRGVVGRLVGQVCSATRAAMGLLHRGFHEESRAVTRGVGELADLLLLFALDPAAMLDWDAYDAKQRQERFGPGKVVLRLEALNVHAFKAEVWDPGPPEPEAAGGDPDVKPDAHEPPGDPACGVHFREADFVAALRELARALAWASVPLPRLLGLDDRARADFADAAAALSNCVRPAGVVTPDELRAEMRRQAVEGGSRAEMDLSATYRVTPVPVPASTPPKRGKQQPHKRPRARS